MRSMRFNSVTIPHAFKFQLKDGSRALFRRIQADDKWLLRDGFRRLSEESRLRRFFMPLNELSEQQLRFFTELDHDQHTAWGAAELDSVDGAGIGVARLIRLDGEPARAEAAFTVVDDYQGTGVGTTLFALMNIAAAHRAIDTLVLDVMDDNGAFIRRLEAWGGEVRERGHGVSHLEVPVRTRLSQVPTRTESGRVLRDTFVRLSRVRPLTAAVA